MITQSSVLHRALPAISMKAVRRSLLPVISLKDFGRVPSTGCNASTALSATRGAGSGADSPTPPAQEVLPPLPAGLYLVATPLGCLEDITMRAVRVLRNADKVLCEDTRRTAQLLNHLGIKANSVESFHQRNEHGKATKIIRQLQQGAAIAVVCDAGTPCINDPGADLVTSAAAEGLPIIPVPGPSAVLAALVASGLPTATFMFCGFVDAKSSARRKQFAAVQGLPTTLIFFVPPHALLGTLEVARAVLGGGRRCCLARELTKLHEELFRSTIDQALQEFTSRAPRGEFTMVIEGCGVVEGPQKTDEEIVVALREAVAAGQAPSIAAKSVAAELHVAKKRVYSLSLKLEST